jgi:hypothetical protein
VVSIPVVRSMLSHESGLVTFQCSGGLEPYNSSTTLSVEFPGENAGTICQNLADLYSIRIHVPSELTAKTVTLQLKDVTAVKLLEAVFPEEGIKIRCDGCDIYVTNRPLPEGYPRTVEAFSWMEKTFAFLGMAAAVGFFIRLFWRRHIQKVRFDLWKVLGFVFILAGCWSVLQWKESADAQTVWELIKPLNAWFILTGIGLWLRFPWARYLGLIVGWGSVALLIGVAFKVLVISWVPFFIGRMLPALVIVGLLHAIKFRDPADKAQAGEEAAHLDEESAPLANASD